MSRPSVPEEEIVPRGEEIYEQDIRPMLGPEHEGMFVVLDVETGNYEVSDDDGEAFESAEEKHPEAAFKDYERLPDTLAALHFVAFACLFLRQASAVLGVGP